MQGAKNSYVKQRMNDNQTLMEKLLGKRVGVCLASGFFGFYHHTGVLAALEEKGIRPVRMTGTSAGALTASMYAAGLKVDEIKKDLLALDRKSFWDMHLPTTRLGFWLLAGHRFKAELGRALPVHSFEECSIPLTVGVYDLDDGRAKHISKGPLIPAVYASCALPYLFTPAEIDGRRYWDGGFGEKCALVPFLKEPDVDVVLVSYMPRSRSRRKERSGLLALLPPISSLFANTPYEERHERDLRSVELLRQANKAVYVLAPERVWLGPFTMQKGEEAIEHAFKGTLKILESIGDESLGHADLK
jgi:predicted acylesterase/phospholipase RssA